MDEMFKHHMQIKNMQTTQDEREEEKGPITQFNKL